MPLELVPLTSKYPLLYRESQLIQQEVKLDDQEVEGVYFLVMRCFINSTSEVDDTFRSTYTCNSDVNHQVTLTGLEHDMYMVQVATSYGIERYELEIPLHYDEQAFHYIVLALTNKRFVIARFGTTEVDYELDHFMVYDEDTGMIKTLQDLDETDVIYNVLLQKFK
jgi:hypothetical protein